MKSERPLEWVPEEKSCKHETVNEYSEIPQIGEIEERDIVDIFSVHSATGTVLASQAVPANEVDETSAEQYQRKTIGEGARFLVLWTQQFQDALMLEDTESKKVGRICLRMGRFWQLILLPWGFLFAFLLPYHIARLDCLYLLSNFHQWESLHCDKAI